MNVYDIVKMLFECLSHFLNVFDDIVLMFEHGEIQMQYLMKMVFKFQLKQAKTGHGHK